VEIERKPRAVTIFRLDLVSLQGDETVIEVDCSGGTYIRTLAEDIGKVLGCGAHLTGLERTASGDFKLDHAITPEALERLDPQARIARLLPPDVMVAGLPTLQITAEAARLLKQGKTLPASDHTASLAEGDIARGYVTDKFIGLVVLDCGVLKPYRLMATGC
jgi:tRNA pseudouridine55 synthase